ncbi:protein translation factor SUI1 homolog 2-like [Gossypium raimondii]|uniref:protein translation factor SUI1 homolog 2-like n=1 Tax=Gossypium raimondii TaxID=29730 RepID=UPI00227C2267|nr:protein translation factor SUI1 homolog 2-like [Gossypium raimondii]
MTFWADPFTDAHGQNSGPGAKEITAYSCTATRNGCTSLTTVQGLKKEFSYSKILKDLKEFCCNGTVVRDPELGQARKQWEDSNEIARYLESCKTAKAILDKQEDMFGGQATLA